MKNIKQFRSRRIGSLNKISTNTQTYPQELHKTYCAEYIPEILHLKACDLYFMCNVWMLRSTFLGFYWGKHSAVTHSLQFSTAKQNNHLVITVSGEMYK